MNGRWRHKKRGTEYTIIGNGLLQSDAPILDEHPVVVYRGDDGTIWVRPPTEFFDGRFEMIGEVVASADENER